MTDSFFRTRARHPLSEMRYRHRADRGHRCEKLEQTLPIHSFRFSYFRRPRCGRRYMVLRIDGIGTCDILETGWGIMKTESWFGDLKSRNPATGDRTRRMIILVRGFDNLHVAQELQVAIASSHFELTSPRKCGPGPRQGGDSPFVLRLLGPSSRKYSPGARRVLSPR